MALNVTTLALSIVVALVGFWVGSQEVRELRKATGDRSKLTQILSARIFSEERRDGSRPRHAS